MNIDIRTLAIIAGIASLLQVIALFLQYRLNKAYQGIGWWLLSFASMVVGYGLIAARELISIKLITIITANFLITLGPAFIYIGIMRFLDKKENRSIVFSIFAVFFLFFFYYTYFDNNITLRTVIIYAIAGFFSLLTVQSLFLHKTRVVTTSAYFNALLLLINGCFFVFRAVETLTIDPVHGLFTPTLMQAVSFLVIFIYGILLTFGLIIMINQRLNAENSEAKENLELIFNTSPDAVLVTSLTDGYFAAINDGFTVLSGYTRAEVIGKSSLDINLWKYPAERQQFVTALTEKGFCENLEVIFQRKDGSNLTAMVSARIITMQGTPHIISVTRDITERKQAENAIKESELKYRSIIECSSDAIFCVDEKGQYQFTNHLFSSTFGKPPDYFIGKTFWDIYPKEHADKRYEVTKRVFQTGASESLEVEVPLPNKTLYYYATADPIKDETGKVILSLTHATDLTDRKQAEEEKRLLENQNRQLHKSESLGRMAAAIAHHFNNKLGAVIGNLELALIDAEKGAEPQAHIGAAMESSLNAAEMSRLMLTYLGQSFDKREQLDLSDTCLRDLPMLQALMPANVVLETNLPLPGPVIMANTNLLLQVLTNLIANAREATEKDGGTISLSVKTVLAAAIPPKNRFPLDWQSQDNAYACLEVADMGSGIDEKDIEKLFDPFYSTKFTGRGMGLAVVMGIVKNHKGVLTVESTPKHGSAFRVFFPLSEFALRQNQEAGSKNDKSISTVSPGKMEVGGTILVVEDEELLRDMTATMLENLGFSTLKAKDGIEALDVFWQNREKIRFVLTDLTMPRMGGWDTLAALRKLHPGIPVILASGYDLAHVMEGDHPELPQAFLAKPYNIKALSDAIRQAMESGKC